MKGMARMLQDNVFTRCEGDRWFARNRDALDRFDAGRDIVLRLIELYDLRPARVVEIGAANGFRLAAINARTGADVLGLDASWAALVHGKNAFPRVRFVRSTASAVPLRGAFGLVIVNFVFHWVDRSNLFHSLAEVDRLVGDDGYLAIGDFYPSNLLKVNYHHAPEQRMFTYKQNYSAMFLASGLYHPIALLTSDHACKKLDPAASESERVGTWLLRKSVAGHYMPTELHEKK
jgi:SAM-dependent methyltransferase